LSTRPYLLFANPDLTVDFEDLGQLQAHLARYGGLVAPRLLNVDGSRQANARGYPFLLDKIASRGWRLPSSRVDAYLWPTPDETLWLMGAAVATTRSDLVQVGGWPERFFIYFEDHELGIIYREHGLPVSCLEDLTWTHGWARAPVKAAGLAERLRGWKHELTSAIKFYARHRGSRARPGRRWTTGNR
jgi:N-acetylglucosaminyl-diphospho-decaprenol L-rhamnosyltransferase